MRRSSLFRDRAEYPIASWRIHRRLWVIPLLVSLLFFNIPKSPVSWFFQLLLHFMNELYTKMKKLSIRTFHVAMTLGLLTILFTGCSKNLTSNTDSLYVPTTTDVTSSASLTDLQAGRIVFINNCGRCHSLYSPDSYSPSSWKTIIPNMAPRAGLSASEALQVTKYVTRGK